MSELFYAHTHEEEPLPGPKWQPLEKHLESVGRLVGQYLSEIASNEVSRIGVIAGLQHDLGKYRHEFQQMLRGLKPPREKTFHKQAGAAIAAVELKCFPAAFAIAGHHGGIPNKTDLESAIRSPNGLAVGREVWDHAVRNIPELAKLTPFSVNFEKIHADLTTRLIFSSLVDADWTDTAAHERSVNGLPLETPPAAFQADQWLAILLEHLRSKSEGCPQENVKACRKDVLDACLNAAETPPGIFSLTVPTGGGKTLASMAFALKHAMHHKTPFRRIIYVAPYLTILEQNEESIREALGIPQSSNKLFVHHSLAEPPEASDENSDQDAAARRAENWDAPIIITTSVQFFESLFSNKPARSRKLHNIPRSIVILDECQTLPPEVVAPTCGMLRKICENWGTTIVLCTATQPAFSHEAIPAADRLRAKEIIPDSLKLFDRLKRVSIQWPTSPTDVLSWPQLAHQMTKARSALCIVNSRRAAREIWEVIRELEPRCSFHLSTSMCPAHRKVVLKKVRQLLRGKKPCFLVSTQLIEAGVDVDFPVVFRELAPLEAIIQAAGRCNREGQLTDEKGEKTLGQVIAFRSQKAVEEPRKYFPPDQWYVAGRSTLENHFLNTNLYPRVDRPDDIDQYFKRLYHSGSLDKHYIQDDRCSFKFAAVAENYRIIKDESIAAVVATWESHRNRVEKLLKVVRRDPSRSNFRALAPYQVNLRYYELRTVGESIVPISDKIDHPVWYGRYDENLGLSSEAADSLLII